MSPGTALCSNCLYFEFILTPCSNILQWNSCISVVDGQVMHPKRCPTIAKMFVWYSEVFLSVREFAVNPAYLTFIFFRTGPPARTPSTIPTECTHDVRHFSPINVSPFNQQVVQRLYRWSRATQCGTLISVIDKLLGCDDIPLHGLGLATSIQARLGRSVGPHATAASDRYRKTLYCDIS